MSLLTNKYVWALAAGAIAVGVLWVWHTGQVHRAAEAGYERGLKDERLVWQIRENHEVNAKNALIKQLQEKYRALEQQNVAALAAIAVSHQKEIRNVKAARDKALADARAGMAFRLRWAASCAPTPKRPGGDSAAAAGADPGGAGGTATCELPEAVRDSLIGEAARADRVVLERNALLEVAKKDREVCR